MLLTIKSYSPMPFKNIQIFLMHLITLKHNIRWVSWCFFKHIIWDSGPKT